MRGVGRDGILNSEETPVAASIESSSGRPTAQGTEPDQHAVTALLPPVLVWFYSLSQMRLIGALSFTYATTTTLVALESNRAARNAPPIRLLPSRDRFHEQRLRSAEVRRPHPRADVVPHAHDDELPRRDDVRVLQPRPPERERVARQLRPRAARIHPHHRPVRRVLPRRRRRGDELRPPLG